jgi:hypothetical protein
VDISILSLALARDKIYQYPAMSNSDMSHFALFQPDWYNKTVFTIMLNICFKVYPVFVRALIVV